VYLQQLTAEHLFAVLEFETVNRDYFAETVPDRGDDFFADYPARHAALLAMQAAGTDIFHVVLTDDGTVAGRVNLVGVSAGEAEIGFRVGRGFAGRGLATEAVRRAVHLARSAYGLTRLRAGASADNHGSRTVLLRNGFAIVGETTVDGRPAHLFSLDLDVASPVRRARE
jgi:ribosomal-protein-alanine N-acetyltransferase